MAITYLWPGFAVSPIIEKRAGRLPLITP